MFSLPEVSGGEKEQRGGETLIVWTVSAEFIRWSPISTQLTNVIICKPIYQVASLTAQSLQPTSLVHSRGMQFILFWPWNKYIPPDTSTCWAALSRTRRIEMVAFSLSFSKRFDPYQILWVSRPTLDHKTPPALLILFQVHSISEEEWNCYEFFISRWESWFSTKHWRCHVPNQKTICHAWCHSSPWLLLLLVSLQSHPSTVCMVTKSPSRVNCKLQNLQMAK